VTARESVHRMGGVVDSKELIELLQELEQRSRQAARGLPQQEQEADFWEGIVFSVAGKRLVSALSDLIEILEYPPNTTRVPGARSWMRGIANVRGSLLPIVDLQEFLGGAPTSVMRKSRVLVFAHGGSHFGLLVGESVGMRHFALDNKTARRESGGPLGSYVEFGFEQEGAYWPVFSMRALASSEEFQNAAA